jgi:hypothetical protein
MKKLAPALCGIFVIAVMLATTGCETESVNNNDVSITPVSIGLYVNQYADFTASGGYDYKWSLQNPTWGVLSDFTGPTTRYTDRYDPGTNLNASAVQVLIVTSTIQGESGSSPSSSNTVAIASNATTGTATAQIEHLSVTAGVSTNAAGIVSINPSSASLPSIGSQAEFTASGGTGTYSWSLGNPSLGSISQPLSDVAVVTSTYAPGSSNTVTAILTATDSGGNSGWASLTFTGD